MPLSLSQALAADSGESENCWLETVVVAAVLGERGAGTHEEMQQEQEKQEAAAGEAGIGGGAGGSWGMGGGHEKARAGAGGLPLTRHRQTRPQSRRSHPFEEKRDKNVLCDER